MNNIRLSKKMDTSNDFYIKHNMHAVEGKLNMIIAKNPHLINSPLSTK